jgi:hypothetical protein
MMGQFLRAASDPAVADNTLTFQITGNPLHALIALFAPVLFGPNGSRQGDTTDV